MHHCSWKHMCIAHQQRRDAERGFRHPTPNKHPNAYIKVTKTQHTQKSRTVDAHPWELGRWVKDFSLRQLSPHTHAHVKRTFTPMQCWANDLSTHFRTVYVLPNVTYFIRIHAYVHWRYRLWRAKTPQIQTHVPWLINSLPSRPVYISQKGKSLNKGKVVICYYYYALQHRRKVYREDLETRKK